MGACTVSGAVRSSLRWRLTEGTKAVSAKLRLDANANLFCRDFRNFADDDVLLQTGMSFPIAYAKAHVCARKCLPSSSSNTWLLRVFLASGAPAASLCRYIMPRT